MCLVRPLQEFDGVYSKVRFSAVLSKLNTIKRMMNKKEPFSQTGAYLSYVTV